jgi:5-methylcytosine-specific restriction endonuclease McrA
MTEIDITLEPRSKKFKDRTGEVISKLTVVGLDRIVKVSEYKKPDGSARTKVYWKCQCECGTVCIKNNDVLNNKKRNFSCGCFRKQRIKETKTRTKEEHRPGIMSSAMARYRIDAQKRGHSFELTKEQFIKLVDSECFYCGVRDSQFITHRENEKHYFNGIDRIDNRNGYVIDNVVSCCKKCNTKKSGIEPEMVLKLYNIFKEKGII